MIILQALVLFFSPYEVGAFGESKAMSVAAGRAHSCALMQDSTLQCWGDNSLGQLGLGNDRPRSQPTKVSFGDGKKATFLSSRGDHSCLLFEGGFVKCWGANIFGELGLGTSTNPVGNSFNQSLDKLDFLRFGTGKKVAKIAVGGSHTCALLDTGIVKCWGRNGDGQLGLGDTRSRGATLNELGDYLPPVNLGEGQVAIDIAAGESHTCAVLQNRTIKCWGNYRGIGSEDSQDLGDDPVELGDDLLPVNLGKTAQIKKVTCGNNFTCVLLMNGSVKCWGENTGGVLGIGKPADDIIGDEPNELGEKLPSVPLAKDALVDDISCGGLHCCARFINNAIKCWGTNESGELGAGDTKSRGLNLADMGENLPFVDLGRLAAVKGIGLGLGHACAILDSGVAKCWGYNRFSQLGDGGNKNIGVDPAQMGDNLASLRFGEFVIFDF